uniref:Uncharacterized protein n=1 Tax=Hucho hucho TaxID=62062 RepID=A0A4W5LJN3_9TELE
IVCGGRSPPVMNHTKGGLVIFSANSHPSSREISKRIGESSKAKTCLSPPPALRVWLRGVLL